jgi:hypothetical protein
MRTRAMGMLLVVVFIAGISGHAGAATEVMRVTFKGSQTAVGFTASASVTCADGSAGLVSAFGFLSGADQLFVSTGQPTIMANGVFVEIDSFANSCTNEFFGFATGSIVNGYTPPNKKLDEASLVGSTLVQDLNGASFSFSANIDVVGSGPTSQGKSNSHNKVTGSKGGPLTISISHFANANRSGTPSGTITIAGFTLVPEFFFATLSSNDNSSLTVTK